MSKNSNLNKAKSSKNDEFYTRIEDIEKELSNYKDKFNNKIVYTNCDNPTWSAFWKYFHLNFETLGLKKLISTHYDKTDPTYKMEYTGGDDNNIEVGVKTPLEGNGDFRSQECIDILKKVDIVVTNSPFSLFREYINMLIKYNKQFLIIGNINAITYKEVFPSICNNKIWLGCRSLNKDMFFNVPKERKEWLITNKKEGSAYKIIDGIVMGRLASACWFTNIDHSNRHKWFETTCKYNQNLYQKYDNYDAININKVKEIPMDYDGLMGVPITFLDKYNPNQFEIVGEFNHGSDNDYDLAKPIINGKELFPRIAIKYKRKYLRYE